MKRLLYLLVLLAVLGLAAAGFYFLRYRESPPPAVEINEEQNLPLAPASSSSSEPSAPAPAPVVTPSLPQTRGLRLLYPNPLSSFTVRPDSSILAMEPSGKVVEIQGNTANVLSPAEIASLQKTTFSSDGSKILALFGDRTKLQAGEFDAKTRTWQPFPIVITDAAWAPTGSRVAYLAPKNSGVVLGVIDRDKPNSKPQELLTLRLQDLSLSWPSPNQIVLEEKGSGLLKTSAWSFDLQKKTLAPLAVEQQGLDIWWGKGTGLGFAFVAGERGRGGALHLLSSSGEIVNTFSFFTFPEKCAPIATSATSTPLSLLCAVPRNADAFSNSILPDTYRKRAAFSVDDFYIIDRTSGAIRTLPLNSTLQVDGVNLETAENSAYFINRYDQKLYSLPLGK